MQDAYSTASGYATSRSGVKLKGLVMFSIPPLLCLLFCVKELWERHPAYQFFPLPILGLALLLVKDLRASGGGWAAVPAFRFVWMAHLAAALVSFVWLSPFLAGMALLLAAVAFALAMAGRGAGWYYPALVMFLIPPPLELDSRLHHLLSGLATRLSEVWLDRIGVQHVLQGAIVVTPGKSFFVDDACSGTNTLLVAVILCALKLRPWFHAWAVTGTAALISIASNVLRILVVIYGSSILGRGLDQGMSHELVGLAFFFLDLVLVLSADHLVSFIFNTVPAVAGPADCAQGGQRPARIALPWSMGSIAVTVVGVAAISCSFGLLKAATNTVTSRQQPVLSSFQMPASIAGWSMDGRKEVESYMVQRLGVQNQVWLFHKGGLDAFVSLNYPFTGFHDTRFCYLGNGWTIDSQQDVQMPGDKAATLRSLTMTKLSELSRASLWLSLFDDHGRTLPFPEEGALNRLRSRLVPDWTQSADSTAGSTYVLQVLVPETTLAAADRADIDHMLAALRSTISQTLAGNGPANLPHANHP